MFVFIVPAQQMYVFLFQAILQKIYFVNKQIFKWHFLTLSPSFKYNSMNMLSSWWRDKTLFWCLSWCHGVISGGSIRNYSRVIQWLCLGVFGRFRHIFEILVATSQSEGGVFCYRPIGIKGKGWSHALLSSRSIRTSTKETGTCFSNLLNPPSTPQFFQPPSGDRIGTLISTPCKIITEFISFMWIVYWCIVLGNPTIVL